MKTDRAGPSLSRRIRFTLAGVALVFAALLIAPFFIDVDDYREQLASQLTLHLGAEVGIGRLDLRLLPLPELIASDITITRSPHGRLAEIGEAGIQPAITEIFSGRAIIDRLTIEDARIDARLAGLLTSPPGVRRPPGAAPAVSLRAVRAENVRITHQGREHGPLDLEADLTADNRIDTVRIRSGDGALRASLRALDGPGMRLELDAAGWTPPAGAGPAFDTLNASGSVGEDFLRLDTLDATLGGGSLSGDLDARWGLNPAVSGAVTLDGVDAAALSGAFGGPWLTGRLSGSARFHASGPLGMDLAGAAQADGDFTVRDGAILNADLQASSRLTGGRAEDAAGQTPFDELRGSFTMRDGTIRFDPIEIRSPALKAAGMLAVNARRELDGEIEVGLNEPTGIVNIPLRVAGTVDEPSLRPTRAALVGGAVGTAILGPGLGTAAGIKAGQLLKKLGRKLGSGNGDAGAELPPDDEEETF